MELSDRINSTLNIAVIADQVGSYLTLDDLKSCRLVSKDWYNWSSLPLRKQEVVVLRRVTDIEKLVRYPDSQYQLRPYRRFIFKLPILEGKLLSRHLNSFWTIHSSSLTTITLGNVDFCALDVFTDILYRQTPNLKRLGINSCFNDQRGMDQLKRFDFGAENRQQTSVTSLEIQNVANVLDIEIKVRLYTYILLLYPKLKTLRYRCEFFHSPVYAYLDSIFHAVVPLRKSDPKQFCLTELHLIDAFCVFVSDIPMHFVETLQQLSFPLETLTINIGWNTQSSVLAALLKLYQNTLQKLDVAQCPGTTVYSDFPWMKFHSHVCGVDGLMFYFSSELPSPDVQFETDMLHGTNPVAMADVKLEKLKELRFDYNCNAVEIRNKLSKWMPNVQILTMSALKDLDRIIDAILEGWPDLQELYLRIGHRSSAKAFAKHAKLKELKRVHLFSSCNLLSSTRLAEWTIPDNHKLPALRLTR